MVLISPKQYSIDLGGGVIREWASAINLRRRVLFPEELGPDIIIPNGDLNFKSLSENVEISIMIKENINNRSFKYPPIVQSLVLSLLLLSDSLASLGMESKIR